MIYSCGRCLYTTPHKEEYLKLWCPSCHVGAMGLNTPSADPVHTPVHYTHGGIECIDAIRAALTEDEFRGFCKGNVLKYTWREKLKGGAEDLKKAAVYLGWAQRPRGEQS